MRPAPTGGRVRPEAGRRMASRSEAPPSLPTNATTEHDMDPQTIEKAIKRCIDISTRLGALEDEVPPAASRVIVQCVDEIDEMQRWLEGRE